MVEILAGNGIENAFKDLKISAKNTYRRVVPNDNRYHGEIYEVWELSEVDHETLCSISDEDWKSEWGWWRSAKSSNMGTVDGIFTIKNKQIKAWDGAFREDAIKEEWEEKTEEEKNSYFDFEDYMETWYPHNYSNLLGYFCEEIGASTEKNICALATDLAKQNNMAMGELFTEFM